MSEQLGNSYKTLFQLQVLHHYWLDDGLTVFDQLDDAQKTRRLANYDVRKFLSILPTEQTAKTLNALSCLYKQTRSGLLVSVQQGTVIPNDTVLEWIISITDSDFFNYTALTLRGQKIYNLYHAQENRWYRYKENVLLLSNLTGATRGAGLHKTLFLSQEIPNSMAADEQIEALILSGNKLKQLNGDQPGALARVISTTAKDLPVFVNQADTPSITAPAGLDGVPKRGLLLNDAIPDSVFAMVRLHAVRASNDLFSFINNSGIAKSVPPLFQIRFKNRSTIWQYFNQSNGVFKSEEANPLPLTYFGNAAGTKRKPSAGVPKAIKDGVRISRLVSEIFE